jgi:hypothetical protein
MNCDFLLCLLSFVLIDFTITKPFYLYYFIFVEKKKVFVVSQIHAEPTHFLRPTHPRPSPVWFSALQFFSASLNVAITSHSQFNHWLPSRPYHRSWCSICDPNNTGYARSRIWLDLRSMATLSDRGCQPQIRVHHRPALRSTAHECTTSRPPSHSSSFADPRVHPPKIFPS